MLLAAEMGTTSSYLVTVAEGLGLGEPVGPLLAILCIVGGIATAFFTATKLDADEKGPQITALARRLAELAEDEIERKSLGPG